MNHDIDGAVEFLESAFRAAPKFTAVNTLQDGWGGAPEFLAAAATRLGALVGRTGAGDRTLFVDMAQLDAIRAAQASPSPPAPPASAPAPTATAQPAPAPSTPTRTAAPVAAKPEKPMAHSYTDAELRDRISRILNSTEAQGRENLAVHLLLSPTSIDEALALMNTSGRSRATLADIDREAVFASRAADCRRGMQPQDEGSPVTASTRQSARLDPDAIYARRATETVRAAGR
jgi:hypothetical protein